MATIATTLPGGQVTVTVTAVPDATGTPAMNTESSTSTFSIIYIYSASATAPQSTAGSSSAHNQDPRVSGGVIAGIVVGCLALLLLMLLIIFCFSRKIARRKRAEIAASRQPSRATAAPSRGALSNAPQTAHRGSPMPYHAVSRQHMHSPSVSAMSGGAQSAGTGRWLKNGGGGGGSGGVSPVPPAYHLLNSNKRSNQQLAELPSTPTPTMPHKDSARTLRLVDVTTPHSKTSGSGRQPEVAEMHGISVPVMPTALQHSRSAGDLVSGVGGGGGRGGMVERKQHQHHAARKASSAGRSDGTGARTVSEYGATTDGAASIHIYYRNSAATIAEAMSQASLRSGSGSGSGSGGSKVAYSAGTSRRGSVPLASQSSLADTMR